MKRPIALSAAAMMAMLGVLLAGSTVPVAAQTVEERARLEEQLRRRALQLERAERIRSARVEEALARLRRESVEARERLREADRVRLEELRAALERQRLRSTEAVRRGAMVEEEVQARAEAMERLRLREREVRREAMWERGAGLALAAMNPGLSTYFAAEEGVLVLDVAGASSLGLQAGDVIQAIGGRKVGTEEDVWRILASYERGEAVSFAVVRQGKTMTVEGERH